MPGPAAATTLGRCVLCIFCTIVYTIVNFGAAFFVCFFFLFLVSKEHFRFNRTDISSGYMLYPYISWLKMYSVVADSRNAHGLGWITESSDTTSVTGMPSRRVDG